MRFGAACLPAWCVMVNGVDLAVVLVFRFILWCGFVCLLSVGYWFALRLLLVFNSVGVVVLC